MPQSESLFKYSLKTNPDLSYSAGSAENYSFVEDTLRHQIDLFAQLYPDHVAYIFAQNAGLQLTYLDLKRRVESMARNLIRIGFKPGDRLAIQLPDTFELMILIFSCAYTGVIAVPIDLTRFPHEIEGILVSTSPRGIILIDKFDEIDYAGNFRPERFPQLEHIIVLSHNEIKPKIGANFSNFDDVFSFDSAHVQLPETSPHDIFVILFTSGTTGPKKGSASTLFKFLNSSSLYLKSLQDSCPDWLESSCNCLSFSFSAMLVTGFLPPLLRYPTQIVFPSFRRNVVNTLNAIDIYQCKSLFAPPKFIADLVNHESFSKFDSSRLRYVQTVGQILTLDAVNLFFRRWPSLRLVVNNYGMTEILRTCFFLIKSAPQKENSYSDLPLGTALPFVELKVVEPKNGEILPVGHVGELCVRSFSTMSFYWNDEKGTKETLDDFGWFHTGDIVFMDKKGVFHYKNRCKEVIRFQDADVFPSDLEAFLRSQKSIADANVFSIKKNGYDEYLCVWIKLKRTNSSELNVDRIRQLLQPRIHASRKLFVKFVNDFPTNDRGKVVKNHLSKVYKQELNL